MTIVEGLLMTDVVDDNSKAFFFIKLATGVFQKRLMLLLFDDSWFGLRSTYNIYNYYSDFNLVVSIQILLSLR